MWAVRVPEKVKGLEKKSLINPNFDCMPRRDRLCDVNKNMVYHVFLMTSSSVQIFDSAGSGTFFCKRSKIDVNAHRVYTLCLKVR